MTHNYDVAIVGGGAAGLSAALVLARARRRVVVLDAGNPRNAPAAHMHNFLSRDGMPPAELLAVGRAEVRGYGAEIVSATALAVEVTPTGFSVALDRGNTLAARRVLIATGLTDELPDLAGVRERWDWTCCIAPIATVMRSATSHLACWAQARSQPTRRCWCASCRLTSCFFATRLPNCLRRMPRD